MLTESYEEKVGELERFNKLMVNREIKIAELKAELKKTKNHI
jgi:hypothetical protein